MSVNTPILVGIIAYNVIVIVAVSIWLAIRKKTHALEDDYILSGRQLPAFVVGATQALTILGGGHIMGLTGQAQVSGIATWCYPLAHAFTLFLILYFYGPWMRRLGVTTVGEAFSIMWSPATRPLIIGGTIACCFGILTLETQGLGAIFAIVTNIEIWQGCIIGAVIGLIYVLFYGMREVGWVNVVNAVAMWIMCIIAAIMFSVKLNGGWAAVNDWYMSNGMEQLLHVFGDKEIIRTYVIGSMCSILFGTTMTQATMQTSISAKNINVCKRAALFAIPLNVVFGVFVIAFGMAAQSAGYGTGGGTPVFAMAIDLLPLPMAFMLLGVFLAAILSTFAMMLLGSATCFCYDIQKSYFAKREWTPKEDAKWVRIWIFILIVLDIVVATVLPPVSNTILWTVAWMVPPSLMFVIGMFYKRSTFSCIFTIIVNWIFNVILTVTPLMNIMHIDGVNYAIVMIILTLIIGFITTGLDKSAKPAFFKVYKQQRGEWDAKRSVA
ncbi:MAG: sodium:solute symporter family protein [Clostridiales Family XIII bacterium]|jgi:SSS family solute:Na+ symporter|nr:sodium:solute symporter family protein [Clostridiales Family XIII bacterium]